MNEAFVEINGVRTKVATWGRWIEESKKDTDEIIVLIPGNPGTTGFYKQFAKILNEKTKIPVWCVGHAGHNFADDKSIVKLPKYNDHKDLYGLNGQVEHKIAFFKKYVPEDAKVHLVAHSIGSYMTLELLEHPDVKNKIEHAYLLFPTIEHMAETKNGRFLNNWVRPILQIILFLTWIFTILPNFIAVLLLYVYMFIHNVPRDQKQNIVDLLKPGLLRRVFTLAFEEMDVVKERKNAIIVRNKDKIKLFYGKTDAWAPEEFYNRVKKDIPAVDAELTDINHTFVFHKSADVAHIVSDWIKAKK